MFTIVLNETCFYEIKTPHKKLCELQLEYFRGMLKTE